MFSCGGGLLSSLRFRSREARNVTAVPKKSLGAGGARRVGHSLAGAVAALGAALAPAGAAFADTPSPGVEPLGSPGVTLHVPVDGRLNGYDFTCRIPGYLFTNDIGGTGPASIQPDLGDVLLVFGLTCTSDGAQDNALYADSPTMSVVVDGQSQAVPGGFGCGSGACYWVTEFPRSSKSVILRATGSNGYSQEFSFTLGHRIGPQPEALYASANDWQLTASVGSSSVLATPDPSKLVKNAAVDVAVSSVSLSYFSPADPSQTAPRLDEAWLVMDGSAYPVASAANVIYSLEYKGTLTPNDLTLDLPGHRSMQSQLTGRGGQSDEDGQGLFGGTYYFGTLPATTHSAVLHIAIPSHVPALANIMGNVEEVPVKSQPAPVNISFPAPFRPSPLPAGNPPAWAPSTSSSTVPGGGLGLTVLVVVLAVAAGAGYFVWRRRKAIPVLSGLLKSDDEKRADAASAWLADMAASAPTFTNSQDPASPTAPPGPPAAPEVKVLVPLPVSPPAPAEGELWFCVLGEPQLLPGSVPELSQPEMEIGCFLACRSAKPLTGTALRSAIGAGRADEWSERTVVTYVNGLRRKIGAEHLPDATLAGGYRLVGVSTDFAELTKLVARAQHAPDPEAALALAHALSLVRGVPLSVGSRYGWADLPVEGASLSSQMHDAVISASCKLLALALKAGDPSLAAWAAGKGLMLDPLNVALGRGQLDAAASRGGTSALESAWADITRRYGSQHVGVPDELAGHMRELRNRSASVAAPGSSE